MNLEYILVARTRAIGLPIWRIVLWLRRKKLAGTGGGLYQNWNPGSCRTMEVLQKTINSIRHAIPSFLESLGRQRGEIPTGARLAVSAESRREGTPRPTRKRGVWGTRQGREEQSETSERKSPPFAHFAKDGAPSSTWIGGVTMEKKEKTEVKETQDARIVWG
jgi:hypothetical protein